VVGPLGIPVGITMPRGTPSRFFSPFSLRTALGTGSTLRGPPLGSILALCLIGAALGLVGFALRTFRLVFRAFSAALGLFGFALFAVCTILGLLFFFFLRAASCSKSSPAVSTVGMGSALSTAMAESEKSAENPMTVNNLGVMFPPFLVLGCLADGRKERIFGKNQKKIKRIG
jgi:hypothetical protein